MCLICYNERMKKHKLIVIDDDENLSNILKQFLQKYEHEVDVFNHPKDGIQSLEKKSYDLLILDIMLPDMDGLEVCKQIRKFSDLPILFLSARGDTMDKIIGLELGADDYLAKPFEPRELLARIDTIIRRTKRPQKTEIEFKSELFEINSDTMEILKSGEKIKFTSAEYLAFTHLLSNTDRIISRDELISVVQGESLEVFGRAIDILISRVRQKIGDDPKKPQFIKTIRSQGYRYIGT